MVMKLRIPPVVVFALCALLMWGMARYVSVVSVRSLYVAGGCVAVGTCSALSGVISFRRARTTLNPYKITGSKQLVTWGVYAISRNPMYLGMAMILVGWAFWLGEMLALLGVLFFMAYMTRFQIVPEEKALEAKFGEAFGRYCQRTRRWL